MRRSTLLMLVLFTATLILPGAVMAGDSNSYNWLRDDDGDGIPNCLDPDWYAPEDGDGYQNQNGKVLETTATVDDAGDGDYIRLRLRDGTGENCPDTCHLP